MKTDKFRWTRNRKKKLCVKSEEWRIFLFWEWGRGKKEAHEVRDIKSTVTTTEYSIYRMRICRMLQCMRLLNQFFALSLSGSLSLSLYQSALFCVCVCVCMSSLFYIEEFNLTQCRLQTHSINSFVCCLVNRFAVLAARNRLRPRPMQWNIW